MNNRLAFRRQFLRFLAASPLAASAIAQELLPAIAAPKDAINVMDFELRARKTLPPAHWGYLATGVDDDLTLRMNREAMTHYQLRARRLTGGSTANLKTEILGATWDMPVYLSAVGSQKQFHPEGELGVARAARNQRTVQMLSTVTSTPVEEVGQALGAAPWYQLYMPVSWAETEKMVKRVEAAGCPVLVWTIDVLTGRHTETLTRLARTDTRDCSVCHKAHPITGSRVEINRARPMFAGLSGALNPVGADWTYVDRLKKMTGMKLLIKGIDAGDDARLALEHGADGVIVSNHGGRATETGRGTMDILPEVIAAVGGRIPVFVDGGFRRGTDILKALAIGARAVGIGRPYIWGLASFGQPGVERVLEILRAELELIMLQCGISSLASVPKDALVSPAVRP